MLGVGHPFSEKMFQKHRFFHGLGAARSSEPDEADEADVPDEADEGKMVHGWQFGP